MIELLILGQGPMPPDSIPSPSSDDLKHTPFPTLRLWQGLRALLNAGFSLRVISEENTPSNWQSVQLPEGQFLKMSCAPGNLSDSLLRELRRAPPAAVISLGPFAPAQAASLTPEGIPTWIDLPGDAMAEAQLRGSEHLSHYRQMLMGALCRGDHFSACSHRQKGAILGQLGLMGRLDPQAISWEGVSVIPPGIDPTWTQAAPPLTALTLTSSQKLLVHFGSLNTWSDVQTLAASVEIALKRCPELVFAGIGGAVEGHAYEPAKIFWNSIKSKDIHRRCHRLGWIPQGQLLALLDRAHAAITLDYPSAEAYLGARTRLGLGVARSLPWILTPLSEDALFLADNDMAIPVAPGQPNEIAAAIIDVCAKPRQESPPQPTPLKQFHPDTTMAPLVAWATSPNLGPPPGSGWKGEAIQARLKSEADLKSQQNTPTWRLLSTIHQSFSRLKIGRR